MTSDITAWLAAAGRTPLLTAAEEVHLGTLVRRHQDWPGGPDAAPANVKRAGLRARDRMIRANLRLVVSVAKRFQGRCLPGRIEMIDLLQEGTIGLARGVEKFDPARGYKASTLLFWWIRQGVSRAAMQGGGPIRVPVSQVQLPWDIDKARQALLAELGRDPSADEVAAALGTTAAALAERLELLRRARCTSLDAYVGDDADSSLGDLIADPSSLDPLEAMDQQLALEQLEQALAELPEPDRLALELQVAGGLARDAAAELGCSVQTLRGRQRQAQRRLRQRLEEGPVPAAAAPASASAAPAEPVGELLAEPVQLELAMAILEAAEPAAPAPAAGRPAAAAPDPAPAEDSSVRERMERAWRSNFCGRRRQLVAA